MGPVSFRGAEVSWPNIFSIACPKIEWFCPNITCFSPRKLIFEKFREGGLQPPPPPPPPGLVRLCKRVKFSSAIKDLQMCWLLSEFLQLILLSVSLHCFNFISSLWNACCKIPLRAATTQFALMVMICFCFHIYRSTGIGTNGNSL